jgi:hypothetical protein
MDSVTLSAPSAHKVLVQFVIRDVLPTCAAPVHVCCRKSDRKYCSAIPFGEIAVHGPTSRVGWRINSWSLGTPERCTRTVSGLRKHAS